MNAYQQSINPLAALGDATRRAIVEVLREGERTVGELAAGLPVSRPAVSQHLAVLRSAGLVVERAQGTRHYYRLDPIGLVRLHDRIDAMWGLETGGAPTPASTQPVAPSSRLDAAVPVAAEEPAPDDGGKRGRKKRKKKGGRKQDRS